MSGKFNKYIKDCIKNVELINNSKNRNYIYNNEKNYLSSLKQQAKDAKLTSKQKKDIDIILWNNRNNDGLFSAVIANHFLKENNKEDVLYFYTGQSSSAMSRLPIKDDILKDKNLLIVDLVFHENIYDKLSQLCKSVIVIDDHEQPKINSKNITIITSNSGHGSCALTWEIFYPKEKIPRVLMMIDTADSKKFAKFLPHANLLTSALNFRYLQNPKFKGKWNDPTVYDELWNVINDSATFWIIIGDYMAEVQENMKNQIANNARMANFQGYKVGVLNFNDPVLTKRIGRQINTNFGDKIDFAVLWGWEYTNNAYRVQLIGHHRITDTIDLSKMANQLAKIGGHPRGGGGHGKNIGNFYWPKNKDKDIWTLFQKKYI